MNRVNNEEEREWSSLVSRITAGQDWWTSSAKPIPEQIWFQRFGVQLLDEDFQQDGTNRRGFLIRDRTEARVAASGYSMFKNNDKEFQVSFDVWPFQIAELWVVIVPGLYIMIDGEHKEKCEDNSVCTRKFTRRYLLPKGCASIVKECNYNKGILSITIEKSEIKGEVEKPQKVPITLESWKKIGSKPFEGSKSGTPETLKDPEEVVITCEYSRSKFSEESMTKKESLVNNDNLRPGPGPVVVAENPKTRGTPKLFTAGIGKTPKACEKSEAVLVKVVESPKASEESEAVLAKVVESPKASEESEAVLVKVVETPKSSEESEAVLVKVVESPKACEESKNGSEEVVETHKANDDLKVHSEMETTEASAIGLLEMKVRAETSMAVASGVKNAYIFKNF